MIDFIKAHLSIKVAFASLLAFAAGFGVAWIAYFYFVYIADGWTALHSALAVLIAASNPLAFFLVYASRPEPESKPETIYKIENDSVVVHPNHKFLNVFAYLPWILGLVVGLFVFVELVF